MNGELASILELDPQVRPIALGAMALIGVALCLVGRKVMRPLLSIQGVVVGGLIGFALVGARADRVMLIVTMVICCAAGLVAAWLLFRVWMGMAFGMFLAIVCPTVGLSMQDHGGPQFQPITMDELLDEPAPEEQVVVEQPFTPPPVGPTSAAEARGETEPEAGDDPVTAEVRRQAARLEAAARRVGDAIAADVRVWWDGLGQSGQYTLFFGAGAGGLIGLIIGLVAPLFTASLLTAMVGAGLIVLSAVHLDHPSIDRLADSPPMMLAAMGLITAISVFLQWTFFRKKADK